MAGLEEGTAAWNGTDSGTFGNSSAFEEASTGTKGAGVGEGDGEGEGLGTTAEDGGALLGLSAVPWKVMDQALSVTS